MQLLIPILALSQILHIWAHIPEIVVLHDGTHEQYDAVMEWPQRLGMVFRNLEFRLPKFRLTQTTSLLYHENALLGLVAVARCVSGDILQSVAQKMHPQIPFLRIDSEYCHEQGRSLLTWLKTDWPCFWYAFQSWVHRLEYQQEISYLPYPQYAVITGVAVESQCPFRSRAATHVVDAYQAKFRRNILSGRVLRLGIVNNSLSWIYGDLNDPKTLRFTGVLSDHMESLARALNYSFELVVPKDQKTGTQTSNGSWTGLFGLMVNNETDLMGYATNLLVDRYRIVDWVYAAYDNTFAFVIPVPDVDENWLASAQPYHYKVWIYIIGFLVSLGLLMEIHDYVLRCIRPQASKKSWLLYIFNYLRILLNQGGDDSVNYAPSRITMGVWCVFALVVINLYTSVLTGYLTIPRLKPIIDSFDELVQSSRVRALFFNNSGVNQVFMSPSATGNVAVIAQRAKEHPEDFVKDFEAALEEVAKKRTRVYMDSLPYVYGALAQDYQKHGYCRVSMVRFTFFTVPASFAVPKGSPYWHFLYNARARIVEVGIYKQISKKLIQPSPCMDMVNAVPSNPKLTLSHLRSPYVLSAIGIGLAFLSFLGELYTQIFVTRSRTTLLAHSVHDGKANKKRRSSLRDLTCIGGAVRKVCAERWCRLRGNLLFYFRSHEPWSEPAGIIVLTDVKVNIDLQCDHNYSFTLVFPGGGHQRVSALSPQERNEWVSTLSRSSYNSAKDELQRLEAKLADLKRMSKNLPRLPAPQSTLAYPTCLPLCELWFSCDNLRCSAQGQPPSTGLRIAIAVNEDPLWLPLLRTEIVPKCSNPAFLTTLPVTPDLVVPNNLARLRVTACDVKDMVSHTSIILATAEITLKSLLTQIQSGRVRLQLVNAQGDGMGFVTLATSVVWDPMIPPAAPANGSPARSVEETVEVMGHRRTQSLPPRLNIACPPLPPVGLSHIFLANPRLKTYRLQSGLGGDIVVHESMFESRLNNHIPQQLLRLWIRQEKEAIAHVAKLGNLYPPWHQRQLALLDRCLKRLGEYEDALKVVSERGSCFKTSVDKTEKKLLFLPTNLHVQRLFAHNASLRRTGVFDWVTVGAWSAMNIEPSNAGLSKLLSQDSVQGSVTSELNAIRNTIAGITRLIPQLTESCRLLLAATMAKALQPILKLAESLATKVLALLKIWDAGLCERASRFYEQHKRPTASDQNQPSLLPIKAMAQAIVKELQTLSTHFPCDAADVENANDDDREPAEVVGLNMEASLTVLAGKLEALLGTLNDAGPVLNSLLKNDHTGKNGFLAELSEGSRRT